MSSIEPSSELKQELLQPDKVEEMIESNFAQALKNKQYACYKCRKSDHALNKCPLSIPKKD